MQARHQLTDGVVAHLQQEKEAGQLARAASAWGVPLDALLAAMNSRTCSVEGAAMLAWFARWCASLLALRAALHGQAAPPGQAAARRSAP